MKAWGTALIVVTFVHYVSMLVVHLVAIGAPFGETAAPDIRPGGYDAEEMRAFLDIIGESGRETFYGLLHWLDMIFPPLLAVSILIIFRRTVPRSKGVLIGLYTVPVVAYMVADLSENSFLYATRSGVEFEQTVAMASMMTQAKYGALALALFGLLVGFVYSRRRI